MSSASSCDMRGTMTSVMLRPTTAAAGHPYRRLAAGFQKTIVPSRSVAITAWPIACSSCSGANEGFDCVTIGASIDGRDETGEDL